MVLYPALIKQNKGSYLVYIPDLDTYTEGTDYLNAVRMAKDAVRTKLAALSENGSDLPKPSDREQIIEKVKLEADENIDFSDGELIYVEVEKRKRLLF